MIARSSTYNASSACSRSLDASNLRILLQLGRIQVAGTRTTCISRQAIHGYLLMPRAGFPEFSGLVLQSSNDSTHPPSIARK